MQLTIGTRGSKLALWQAHFLQDELKKLGVKSDLKIIKTQGDKIQNLSFDKLEGKGFFTKEIENALLNNEVDVAVHSHKDLETEQPKGLTIAAVSKRENPADVLIIRKEKFDNNQPLKVIENPVIGTSSARRKALLLSFRPDVKLKDLRGNVPTRINKLRDENYDAIVLAKAGINRLKIDLSEFEILELNPTEFVCAPAQGALAFQTRENDRKTIEIIKKLNHPETKETINVERKILNLLEGGCQLPFGAYCKKNGSSFELWTGFSEVWNSPIKMHYFKSENPNDLIKEASSILKKKVH